MKKTLLFTLLVVWGITTIAQDTTINSSTNGISGFEFDDSFRGNNAIRVMFYNVENLFDIYDDSLTQDEAFTPMGDHHWNNFKYQEKQEHLSKTLVAVGGWEAVEVIGLCEVENRKVLEDLVNTPALKPSNYQIIHQESGDNRGIDVALLYRADKITVDSVQFLHVDLGAESRPTRDVLLATLSTTNDGVFYYFANHWPSRYGGQMESDPKRKKAAATVRAAIDSILVIHPQANIVVMGDFNDYPDNESIQNYLRAKSDSTFSDSTELYNFMTSVTGNHGTHKYKGNWGTLDQIMVSKWVFQGTHKLQVKEGALIFDAPFLLIDETKFPGQKPFRTYNGMKYVAGFSDHLPIFIDLQLLK